MVKKKRYHAMAAGNGNASRFPREVVNREVTKKEEPPRN